MIRFLDVDQVSNFLKSKKDKKVVLTFHSIGDRDGVGAAIAMSMYLKKAVVLVPDFINASTRRVLESINYTKDMSKIFPKDADSVIIFDTSSFNNLRAIKKDIMNFKGDILFIDNHAFPKNAERDALAFGNEEYNSASSIVFYILKTLNFKIDKKSAILLLNGIISDSAKFQNIFPDTFSQISELLKIAQISYSDIEEPMHESIPADKRIELMAALCASKKEVVGKYILIHGKTQIHPSLMADAAIDLGADASIFWAKGKEASISTRLRSPLDKKLDLHMGLLMQKIGAKLKGSGGGHPCAAGAYGPDTTKLGDAINFCISSVKKSFRQ